MDALDKLIEAVEAGTFKHYIGASLDVSKLSRTDAFNVDAAYHGSLDAALALHEALLPGWEYGLNSRPWAMAYRDKHSEPYHAEAETPARAWLLAVLKAYREISR